MTQGQRLAQFARAVRESSVKRFRQVEPGDRAWRPAPGRLSFVDHLKHLVDCDRWVLAVLKGDPEPHADIQPGEGDPARWDAYLADLEASLEDKCHLMESSSDLDLDRPVEHPPHLGRFDAGFLFLRENLDHEIHHRGMVQLLLKLKYP
jgi:uncharacterized damage-inducible protein DinB